MDRRGEMFESSGDAHFRENFAQILAGRKREAGKSRRGRRERHRSIRPCEDHPEHLTGTTFRHVVSCEGYLKRKYGNLTGDRGPDAASRSAGRSGRVAGTTHCRGARARVCVRVRVVLFFCFGKIFTDKSPADEGKRRRITPVRNPDRGR